jgi:ribose-phosphate pyrophosphokinase
MDPILFSGRSHPALARRLTAALGLEQGGCLLEDFADGELRVAVQAVAGEVQGRSPVLEDDMVSTGGTLVAAIKALLEAGVRPEISVIASHCLLVGQAAARLEQLPIQRILTTDSLPVPGPGALPTASHTLACLLADTLRQMTRN